MTVTWKNRAFVNEDFLTEEVYNTFFEHGEYGITLDTANLILSEKEGDEVVPCDELKPKYRKLIAEHMHHDHEGGFLSATSAEGHTVRLCWAWHPYFADEEGKELVFEFLPTRIVDKIISDMLEKQCVWGIVD